MRKPYRRAARAPPIEGSKQSHHRPDSARCHRRRRASDAARLLPRPPPQSPVGTVERKAAIISSLLLRRQSTISPSSQAAPLSPMRFEAETCALFSGGGEAAHSSGERRQRLVVVGKIAHKRSQMVSRKYHVATTPCAARAFSSRAALNKSRPSPRLKLLPHQYW